MAWKTLDDMDLDGRRVLTRVDINVPVEDGRVTDATRIERIKPTIDHIIGAGGTPVLLAHFGRPKGKVVPEMSLAQIVPAREEVLGRKITFADGKYGETLAGLGAKGDVMLCENVRFNPGEEANDEGLRGPSRDPRRHLLQRCLFCGAPRPRLDRSAGAIAPGLRGPADAGPSLKRSKPPLAIRPGQWLRLWGERRSRPSSISSETSSTRSTPS